MPDPKMRWAVERHDDRGEVKIVEGDLTALEDHLMHTRNEYGCSDFTVWLLEGPPRTFRVRQTVKVYEEKPE